MITSIIVRLRGLVISIVFLSDSIVSTDQDSKLNRYNSGVLSTKWFSYDTHS